MGRAVHKTEVRHSIKSYGAGPIARRRGEAAVRYNSCAGLSGTPGKMSPPVIDFFGCICYIYSDDKTRFDKKNIYKKFRTVMAVIVMAAAGIAGFFVGAIMKEAMSGAILFSMIAGIACIVYNLDNREA